MIKCTNFLNYTRKLHTFTLAQIIYAATQRLHREDALLLCNLYSRHLVCLHWFLKASMSQWSG